MLLEKQQSNISDFIKVSEYSHMSPAAMTDGSDICVLTPLPNEGPHDGLTGQLELGK